MWSRVSVLSADRLLGYCWKLYVSRSDSCCRLVSALMLFGRAHNKQSWNDVLAAQQEQPSTSYCACDAQMQKAVQMVPVQRVHPRTESNGNSRLTYAHDQLQGPSGKGHSASYLCCHDTGMERLPVHAVTYFNMQGCQDRSDGKSCSGSVCCGRKLSCRACRRDSRHSCSSGTLKAVDVK